MEITCSCGYLKKSIRCGTLKDHGVPQCEPICEKFQKLKSFQDSEETKLYYSGYLVKMGRKKYKWLKSLEKELVDFFVSADEVKTFSGNSTNVKKIRLLMDLLGGHYSLAVNMIQSKKKFIMDVTKTSEFSIPKVPLSKYIKMIDKKEVNHGVKPFQLYFTFYNLTFNNTVKDLREQIGELLPLCYLEQIHGEVYLFVWKEEDEETFVEKLRSLQNNWSHFKITKKNDAEESEIESSEESSE